MRPVLKTVIQIFMNKINNYHKQFEIVFMCFKTIKRY
jgi:hypothetical protein